mmetsp:Transcript_2765/g.10085  ORF Transcript_2765/g.10085 Transcript_2765/m.10085 type:complete len:271 (+) Transcript_2765:3494-4306(+)
MLNHAKLWLSQLNPCRKMASPSSMTLPFSFFSKGASSTSGSGSSVAGGIEGGGVGEMIGDFTTSAGARGAAGLAGGAASAASKRATRSSSCAVRCSMVATLAEVVSTMAWSKSLCPASADCTASSSSTDHTPCSSSVATFASNAATALCTAAWTAASTLSASGIVRCFSPLLVPARAFWITTDSATDCAAWICSVNCCSSRAHELSRFVCTCCRSSVFASAFSTSDSALLSRFSSAFTSAVFACLPFGSVTCLGSSWASFTARERRRSSS